MVQSREAMLAKQNLIGELKCRVSTGVYSGEEIPAASCYRHNRERSQEKVGYSMQAYVPRRVRRALSLRLHPKFKYLLMQSILM